VLFSHELASLCGQRSLNCFSDIVNDVWASETTPRDHVPRDHVPANWTARPTAWPRYIRGVVLNRNCGGAWKSIIFQRNNLHTGTCNAEVHVSLRTVRQLPQR